MQLVTVIHCYILLYFPQLLNKFFMLKLFNLGKHLIEAFLLSLNSLQAITYKNGEMCILRLSQLSPQTNSPPFCCDEEVQKFAACKRNMQYDRL